VSTRTPAARTAGERREPRGLFGRAPRRRGGGEHASWCVQHDASGCSGQVFALPGTQLLVWLTAPSPDDARLVVEGPDGVTQLPVDA
jgi:hypothetical protein